MSGWILARGREAEQTLTASTPAGATLIALAGANTIFAPRQRLLISEADDSETQWLGKVTQASASTVSFSRGLRLAKSAGARLWRPAAVLEITDEALLPDLRATQTGVTCERSSGGTFYALELSVPQTTQRLTLRDPTPALEQALRAWLADEAQWGLVPFTLIDPTGALSSVRLTGEPIRREQSANGRVSLSLTLVIEQEGTFQ